MYYERFRNCLLRNEQYGKDFHHTFIYCLSSNLNEPPNEWQLLNKIWKLSSQLYAEIKLCKPPGSLIKAFNEKNYRKMRE